MRSGPVSRTRAVKNDIEIDVLGGAVETAGWWSAAVYGWHGGLGSADVEIGANAVVRAKAASATGVSAGLYNNRNAEGRVVIRHAGAIEAGDHGILAWAKRSSGSTFDGSMTADDAARKEPMIHVVSSGTVTVRKPEEERASRDDLSAEDLRDLQDLDESNGVRLEALQELDDILGLVEVGVGAYPRDGWWLVDTIAGGDDRLSPAERAVLAAAATGGDLKAALAALPASAPYIGFNGEQIYGEEYRNAVQRLAFANAYDSGDIQIDITGGRIDSSGDGVVAFSGFPHDRNGAMTVNVEAGAVIAAGRYGILVDGGGLDSETGTTQAFRFGGRLGVRGLRRHSSSERRNGVGRIVGARRAPLRASRSTPWPATCMRRWPVWWPGTFSGAAPATMSSMWREAAWWRETFVSPGAW